MAYSYKKTITIDYTKVSTSNHSDFVMLYKVTDPDLRTVANGGRVQNANAYDVGFFADSPLSTSLYWHIESYNPVTGALVAWIRIPSVSYTANTLIYLAYGDSSISTFQSTATSVWTSSFLGVYHMGDNAANTNILDATSNAITGTNWANTSGRSVTGKIDKALSWSSGNANFGDHFDFSSGDFSISFWVNGDSFNGDGPFTIINKSTQSGGGGIPYRGYYIDLSTSGSSASTTKFKFTSLNTYIPYGYYTAGSISSSGWHHIAFTRSGSNWAWYIDGALDNSGSNFTGPYSSAGYNMAFATGYVAGVMKFDELRFEGVQRSGGWIATAYNNQNSPETFYSVGSETAVGGGTPRRVIIC